MDAVRRIVGPRLLVPAELEMDRRQATDLLVLKARDMRIGVRVRREGYAASFGRQFTIRGRAANGGPTELDKIKEGWGDWLFYGHARGEADLFPWMIVDLDLLRKIICGDSVGLPGSWWGTTLNWDGETGFVWFDVGAMPGSVLVDQEGVLCP